MYGWMEGGFDVFLLLLLMNLNGELTVRGDELQSLMEYFIMAIDCSAMVGAQLSTGWQQLLDDLEKLKPIDHRARCYLYCLLRRTGIIQDEMGFIWDDYLVSQLVAIVVKDNRTRSNFLLRSYFRCKHVVPATLRKSRCDNALLVLVCMRAIGVSFLLTDKGANAEQRNYESASAGEREIMKRLFEADKLSYQLQQTTPQLYADVTVLQGFRAEAFWNSFDGNQKRVGDMKDDCRPPNSVKTLGIDRIRS